MKRALWIVVVFSSLPVLQAQPQFEAAEAQRNIYKSKPEQRSPIQKHDLILIVVKETSRADVGTDLQADRKTEYSLLLDSFVRLSEGKYLKPDAKPQPEIEAEAEVKTKGKGKVKRNDQIETRITARVIDVLDNGNFRLEARRERTVNDETTIITLSGEAPSEAVTADKTLPSDRIADLRMSIAGKGPISSRTGYTWLGRLVDWIWPF